ncbi:hypothetical protein OMW55_03790 [Sphingomonas sp. BN140010]|uniref:Secreted protein n=1 Tax=Sphingomonas arvum TaxID=2992113 RepID=A0ABT3JCW9_9SPHN|nr:hypothetical protein [Sphingomonas sp. BN140010]MCW3796926.1 hypothetical protein [Sphingomonas sp. BN140010]
MRTITLLAAAATLGALAAPAAAQYYPQQPYPQQTYPQPAPYPGQAYPQPGYPQPGYGYGQQRSLLDQLLGRYPANNRAAIQQCANAAQAQVARQYSQGYGNRRYGQYQPGYGTNTRVTAITDVQQRNRGLRVNGLIDSGVRTNGYNQPYNNGYNQPYAAAQGDISFRCDVDYNGQVRDVRLRQLAPGRY